MAPGYRARVPARTLGLVAVVGVQFQVQGGRTTPPGVPVVNKPLLKAGHLFVARRGRIRDPIHQRHIAGRLRIGRPDRDIRGSNNQRARGKDDFHWTLSRRDEDLRRT